jgi:hypothetical protein
MGFNIVYEPGTRPVATPNAPFIADCVKSETAFNLDGSMVL